MSTGNVLSMVEHGGEAFASTCLPNRPWVPPQADAASRNIMTHVSDSDGGSTDEHLKEVEDMTDWLARHELPLPTEPGLTDFADFLLSEGWKPLSEGQKISLESSSNPKSFLYFNERDNLSLEAQYDENAYCFIFPYGGSIAVRRLDRTLEVRVATGANQQYSSCRYDLEDMDEVRKEIPDLLAHHREQLLLKRSEDTSHNSKAE